MTSSIDTISPRLLARMTGLFFLLTIMGGIFAQGFVSDGLVDYGNAAKTANNILSHRGLFQFSYTVFLLEMACNVANVVLFYQLLKPVNRTVALLALCLAITGIIMKTFARVFYLAPLFLLSRPAAHNGFSAEQLQSVALVLLRLNSLGAGAALPFLGLGTLLNGYLIFRSKFLPRVLGILAIVGGMGWMTFLYPSFGSRAFLVVVLVALVGVAATIFWLLVFGVNEEKWRERAGVGAAV